MLSVPRTRPSWARTPMWWASRGSRCSTDRLDRRRVVAAAFLRMIATFPTGIPERRWQRIAVGLVWVPVACRTRSPLLTTPPRTAAVRRPRAARDPESVRRARARAGGARRRLRRDDVAGPLRSRGGATRAFFGDAAVRARTRVMTWSSSRSRSPWPLWEASCRIWILGSRCSCTAGRDPVAASTASSATAPSTSPPATAGAFVTRSSTALITRAVGDRRRDAGVLLARRTTVVGAVLLTTLVAVLLLPLRGWLQRRIHRLVFGDRDGSSACSASSAPGSSRPSNRATCSPSWPRRARRARCVVGAHPSRRGRAALAESPAGVAGDVVGRAGESVDLVHADETLGRIELGPRRRGEYGEAERPARARWRARPRHPSRTCGSPRSSPSSSSS